MRTDQTAGEDTPTAALLRECAAKTVDALLAELRRRPIVQPEWLSLARGRHLLRGTASNNFPISLSAASRRRASSSVATRGASSVATLTPGARRAARAPMPLWASVAEFEMSTTTPSQQQGHRAADVMRVLQTAFPRDCEK